jgi:hypothetical protein
VHVEVLKTWNSVVILSLFPFSKLFLQLQNLSQVALIAEKNHRYGTGYT